MYCAHRYHLPHELIFSDHTRTLNLACLYLTEVGGFSYHCTQLLSLEYQALRISIAQRSISLTSGSAGNVDTA